MHIALCAGQSYVLFDDEAALKAFQIVFITSSNQHKKIIKESLRSLPTFISDQGSFNKNEALERFQQLTMSLENIDLSFANGMKFRKELKEYNSEWLLVIMKCDRKLAEELFQKASINDISKSLSKRQKQSFSISEINEIVNEFGKCIEDLDIYIAFYDEKILPYPKPKIATAIIEAIKLSKSKKDIEMLKIGLLSLPSFQKNVGIKPIYKSGANSSLQQIKPKDINKMSLKEMEKIGEIYLENNKKAKPFSKAYDKEVQKYSKIIDNLKINDLSN
jgi:hypothetical protein